MEQEEEEFTEDFPEIIEGDVPPRKIPDRYIADNGQVMTSLFPENRDKNPIKYKDKKGGVAKKFRRKRITTIGNCVGHEDAKTWFRREPQVVYAWCREQYFAGMKKPQIMEMTGVPAQYLENWVYGVRDKRYPGGRRGGWRNMAKEAQAKAMKIVMEEQKVEAGKLRDEVMKVASDFVRLYGAKVKRNGEDVDIDAKSLKSVVEVAKILNEMVRLEEGRPTSILGQDIHVTARMVLDKLREADPLINYEGKLIEMVKEEERLSVEDINRMMEEKKKEEEAIIIESTKSTQESI